MLVWSACNHDHILKFVGHSFTEDRKKAYLVSPFMKNGNIQHYLSKHEISLPQRLEFVGCVTVQIEMRLSAKT